MSIGGQDSLAPVALHDGLVEIPETGKRPGLTCEWRVGIADAIFTGGGGEF